MGNEFTQHPPFLELTPTNRGPALSVFTFICLSTSFILVSAQLMLSVYISRHQISLNIPLWIAKFIIILQSILVQYSVHYGLGQHRDTISSHSYRQYSKFSYAADLFVIPVLALSKLSTTLLTLRIAPPHGRMQLACKMLMMVVAGWTVFSIFAISLECKTPDPWLFTPDRCGAQKPLRSIVGAFDILTDLFLIGIPCIILSTVQIPLEKRVTTIAAFAARIILPMLHIMELSYRTDYWHSNDPTWTTVDPSICRQFLMNYSVVVACMPTLYHIFSSFNSGLSTLYIGDGIAPNGRRLSRRSPYGDGYSTSWAQDKVMRTASVVGREAHLHPFQQMPNNNESSSSSKNYGNRIDVRADDVDSLRCARHSTGDDHVLQRIDVYVEVEDRQELI